jgi:hypothetical protein
MWNYLMRLEAESIEYRFKNIVGNADGSKTLATRNEIAFQYPQYYKDATPKAGPANTPSSASTPWSRPRPANRWSSATAST